MKNGSIDNNQAIKILENHIKYLEYRLTHLKCKQVVDTMDQVKRSAKIREVQKMLDLLNNFGITTKQLTKNQTNEPITD